jgi:hypothetical protein
MHVGINISKQVQINTCNANNDNSQIDACSKRHVDIDHLPLWKIGALS